MTSIACILKTAQERCEAFDTELLLAHVLGVDRAYLFTWPERSVDGVDEDAFMALIARRAEGEPVAYLTSQQAFWSLDFYVDAHCLIPRPETELLVEEALKRVQKTKARVADLGTGSGAIAISLAHEQPSWEIYAIEQDKAALSIAQKNALRHDCQQIQFIENNWLSGLKLPLLDLIIANPPYIAADDPYLSPSVRAYEPRAALISAETGLADLKIIIQQAKKALTPGGQLLLEHGFEQAEAVCAMLQAAGYQAIESKEDLAGHPRLSTGQIAKID